MSTALSPQQMSAPGLFNQLRRQFDRAFDHMVDQGGSDLVWNGPCVNVAETEGIYEVSVELPGIDPDAIDVELRHGELWITGERRHEEQTEGKTWHRVESQYGHFRRMIRLGNEVDPDNITAEYKDGLLCIRVPKTESAKPRKIAVKR